MHAPSILFILSHQSVIVKAQCAIVRVTMCVSGYSIQCIGWVQNTTTEPMREAGLYLVAAVIIVQALNVCRHHQSFTAKLHHIEALILHCLAPPPSLVHQTVSFTHVGRPTTRPKCILYFWSQKTASWLIDEAFYCVFRYSLFSSWSAC